MGRFIIFICVTVLVSMASNALIGFLVALICSIIGDVFLVSQGKVRATGSNYGNSLSHKNSVIETNTKGINPGSGLPMMDSCIDVGGNAYGSSGFDSQFHDAFNNGW